MIYRTPQALRTALEHRLLLTSTESATSLDRLRRRVMFERIIARIQATEPGRWVLKGGMALEVRLPNQARLTKDVDLGLRDDVTTAPDLHERLIDILATTLDQDFFVFTIGPPQRLRDDGAGFPTWRAKIDATLADKPFGRIQLDISPRTHELRTTDTLAVPNSLDFAGIPGVEVEAIDIHRHAAEKFHGMLRDFGERENSRVRDLLDLVILLEHDLLTPTTTAAAIRTVWLERDQSQPPPTMPPLPESWPNRYERLAIDNHIDVQSYPKAAVRVAQLWTQMFPQEPDSPTSTNSP